MSDEQREKERDRARVNRRNFSQQQRGKEQDRARENRETFSQQQREKEQEMKKNVKRNIYFRKKTDIDRIKEELKKLADDVNLKTESKTVDESGVHRIMDAHIPYKMSSSRHNLPWFNRSLRRQSRAKQRLYNKAKRSGNPTHWPLENACT